MTINKRNKAVTIFVFLLLIISAYFFYIWPKWTVDDAFIVFRYAENFVKHGEINWNVGQDPVEGYTGIAWLLLNSLGILIGFSPLVFSKFLGITFYYLTFLMLFLIAKRLNFNHLFTVILLSLYIFNPAFYTHALSGLETIMFIFFTLLSLYFYSGVILHKKTGEEIPFFMSLLLTSLTRPEGIAYSFVLIAGYLYDKGLKDLRNWKLPLFTYLIPFLAYFTWRATYYGRFFPNTFYAKLNQPFDFFDQLKGFILFSKDNYFFLIPIAIYLFLPVIGSWYFANRDSFGKKLNIFIFPLLATLPAYIVYFKSWLVMNYADRFYLHFAMIHIILALFIGSEGYITMKKKNVINNDLDYTGRKVGFYLILLISALFFFIVFAGSFIENTNYCASYKDLLNNEHVQVGKDLKKLLPDNSWIACIRDAGAVPYYSKLKAVDFGLLNDEYLTTVDPSGPEALNYLFSKDPAAIVITSVSTESISHPINWINKFNGMILADRRFQDNYFLYKVYKPAGSAKDLNYYQFVYIKKNIINY